MSRISAVRSQKLARQGSPHRGDVHNSIRVPRAKVFHDNIGLQGRWGKPLVVDCVGKIIECVLVCVCVLFGMYQLRVLFYGLPVLFML